VIVRVHVEQIQIARVVLPAGPGGVLHKRAKADDPITSLGDKGHQRALGLHPFTHTSLCKGQSHGKAAGPGGLALIEQVGQLLAIALDIQGTNNGI